MLSLLQYIIYVNVNVDQVNWAIDYQYLPAMSYQKFPFLLSKSFKKKRKKRKSVSFCVRKVKDLAPGSIGFSEVMGFLFIYLFLRLII